LIDTKDQSISQLQRQMTEISNENSNMRTQYNTLESDLTAQHFQILNQKEERLKQYESIAVGFTAEKASLDSKIKTYESVIAQYKQDAIDRSSKQQSEMNDMIRRQKEEETKLTQLLENANKEGRDIKISTESVIKKLTEETANYERLLTKMNQDAEFAKKQAEVSAQNIRSEAEARVSAEGVSPF